MSPSSWWTSKLPQQSSPSSHNTNSAKSRTPTKPVVIPQRTSKSSKNAQNKPGASVTVTVSPIKSSSSSSQSSTSSTMSKGRDSRRLAPSSPPSTTTGSDERPTTPSSPVQIPRQSTRNATHKPKRLPSQRPPTSRDPPRSESLSPSVAALLAVTDIPRRRSSQRRNKFEKPLTVNDIIDNQQVSEKELSWNLSGSPLDLLLAPPDELHGDGYFSGSESLVGSALTSTISVDSIPSLGDSFATDATLSLESSLDGTRTRRRTMSPMRKSLGPVRSPPDAADEHPLAAQNDAGQDLESFIDTATADEAMISTLSEQFKPLRAVFKSNLTASLRALRSAAKSFSSINFPSIPPDDFITRSILTMDPKVPYADERRPPVMEDIPSAEIRRYLNPTTRTRLEQPSSTTDGQPRPSSSTSIQMQTYKIQRSRSNSPSARGPYPAISPQIAAHAPAPPLQEVIAVPGMRQREVRENPDFIRIAVMEMAMRKCGKLDDKRPGRAKWALPPRKASLKQYQIGGDGVPARWVPINYD